MLNRSASLAMSTRVLKALPGKLDIKYINPDWDSLIVCFHGKTVPEQNYWQDEIIHLLTRVNHIFYSLNMRRSRDFRPRPD